MFCMNKNIIVVDDLASVSGECNIGWLWCSIGDIEVILGLQNNCKGSMEFPNAFYSASPNVKITYNHVRKVLIPS